MSPLIDIINTVSQDSSPNIGGSTKKEKIRLPKASSRVPDSSSKGRNSTVRSLEKLSANSESVAIKMCNTKVSDSGDGLKINRQGTSKVIQHSSTASYDRVPPLPQAADLLLSQAVEALSLSPVNTQTQQRTRKRHHRHDKESKRLAERVKVEFGASSSGLPDSSQGSESLNTPQQCGACGLEFTSLTVLTQHLARHVYDGLYAAQWLTQAMSMLSSRQSSETISPAVRQGSEALQNCQND